MGWTGRMVSQPAIALRGVGSGNVRSRRDGITPKRRSSCLREPTLRSAITEVHLKVDPTYGVKRSTKRYARLRLGAAAALPFSTIALAGAFFFALTASRLLLSASIRLTTFGGASTCCATTSLPSIFASMISCRPSRYRLCSPSG